MRLGDKLRLSRQITITPDGCWRWTGALHRDGYGRLTRGGRTRIAHRWVYEQERGAIPAGMDLHHRCGNRWCVNPGHLEVAHPYTHGPNSGQTCKRGHPRTPENSYSNPSGRYRQCRLCALMRYAAKKGDRMSKSGQSRAATQEDR